MPIATPFNAPAAKGRPKAIKIRDGTDAAARYLVYKLYDATGGQPMQWHVLHGMGESAATISRAVERRQFARQDPAFPGGAAVG